jgi:predicted RNase H-like nuclease (RuvC/YqgF family)
MRKPGSRGEKPWDQMTVEEKLETLRGEMQTHRLQAAAATRALDAMRDRLEQIERRLEDMLLD